MIGFFLLLVSIIFYTQRKFRYLSIFMYLGFMLGYNGGYGLLTDQIIGCKNSDLAVIYTVLISVFLVLTKKYRFPNVSFKKSYIVLAVFIFSSVLFSFYYYGLSPIQILQGGRNLILFFSFPILTTLTENDTIKVIKLLAIVCLITSLLYILQVIVKHPLMPYAYGYGADKATGLMRFYNIPSNLDFFLALAFLSENIFPKKISINIIKVILLLALLCTLGRTMIFVNFCLIILVLFFYGKIKRIANTIIVLLLLLMPFMGIISKRLESGGTSNDLQKILSGQFKDDYVLSENTDATMLYRIAWCYERAKYLSDRPLGEQLFGLGICSDSNEWVQKRYKFLVGNRNDVTILPYQLTTPDISYGNILTHYGFGGTLIYLIFCINITIYFWKNKKLNNFYLVSAALSILMYVSAFSGSSLSDFNIFSMYFLMLNISNKK